jgi:hypothetical protein
MREEKTENVEGYNKTTYRNGVRSERARKKALSRESSRM